MPNTNETIRPTRLPWVQGNMLTLALPLTIVHLGDTPTTEDYEPQQGDTISVFLKGLMHCKEYTPTVDGNVLYITDNGELEVDSYSVEVVITEASSPNAKRRSRWNYIVDVYDSNEKVVDFFDDFPDWGQGAILQGSIFYGTGGGGGGVQSDWDETDTSSPAYIKNKPSLPVSGATNGNFAGLDASGNVTDSGKKASDFAAASHTHGNISNAGAITTNAAIANGDRLVFSDSSASSKLVRHSTTFDGSTTTTALTPKGTFEAFYKKPSSGIPASDLASGVIPDVSGKEDTSNKTSDISSNASSTTKYPTTKGVADYVEGELSDIEDALDMILGGDTLDEEKKTTIVQAVDSTDATAAITTLSASVDTYYYIPIAVGTLAITLPAPIDLTHINKIVFMLTTGSTPAITFTATAISGTTPSVIAQNGFQLAASKTYEINAIFNGAAWVIAAIELTTTDIQPSNS